MIVKKNFFLNLFNKYIIFIVLLRCRDFFLHFFSILFSYLQLFLTVYVDFYGLYFIYNDT